MNKSRLEAFSDGVLAIIITIMVLEIKVPRGTDWIILKELIPVIMSYFLSFLIIAIYWGNHHHLLHSSKGVTSGIIWANFNLLFWLSLIPIATGWMGENHFAENTVAVYGLLMLLNGISFYILQAAVERNAYDLEALKSALVMQNRKGITSSSLYFCSIPLAYVHPMISWSIFLIVGIIWLIPDKRIEEALRERHNTDGQKTK